MRLSEERINHLARTVTQKWKKARIVRAPAHPRLETLIARVILEDLQTEDEIDREARRRLRHMPSAPPEDSPEWEALFRREKETLAARRGYIL